MTDIPQVQEKAPKPAGVLPKNVQAWLLVGLAFAMVAIMWLTGGKKPQMPAKSLSQLAAPAPAEVNQTKIAEMQNRIEDLQREQLVAQSALAQQTRLLGEAAQDSPQTPQPAGISGPPEQKAEDPIVAERRRRDYVSLFASNVALTYRTPPAHAAMEPESAPAAPGLPAPEADAAQMAQLLKPLQTPLTPPAAPSPATGSAVPPTSGPKEEHKDLSTQNHAAGKTYVVFEGTVLETVLINRLEGEFSGPLECLLSNDVYSNDRQHLLIPAGSKLLGETRKVDTFGQSRLAVVFHRVIMPDGYSASLDQFKGLNQTGDTGLRDEVNNHYLRIFGVSLAIGALGAVAEAGTNGSLNASSSDLMRQGFAASTAQSSAQILDKFLNVMPTVTIREGHRVKVYLSGDLALPDYANHIMPSDL
jgi:type IV secretion system protein VirB10